MVVVEGADARYGFPLLMRLTRALWSCGGARVSLRASVRATLIYTLAMCDNSAPRRLHDVHLAVRPTRRPPAARRPPCHIAACHIPLLGHTSYTFIIINAYLTCMLYTYTYTTLFTNRFYYYSIIITTYIHIYCNIYSRVY